MGFKRAIATILIICVMCTNALAYTTPVTLEVTGDPGTSDEPSSGGSSSGSSSESSGNESWAEDEQEPNIGYPMGGIDSKDKQIITATTDIKPNKYSINLGYIKGYTDNTFKPNRGLTREEFAVIIYRILRFKENKQPDAKFIDVANDRWSSKAINTLAEYKIILGFGNGEYKPTQEVTKEEVVLILDRLLYTRRFNNKPDIEIIGTKEGKAAIKRCYNMGILDSIVNDKTINGKEIISRWQIVSVLNSVVYNNLNTFKSNKFSDIAKKDKYYADIIKATYSGIRERQLIQFKWLLNKFKDTIKN